VAGIDVSHYQSAIDWTQVQQKGGIVFAYAKSTQGLKEADPRFADNWAGMKKAGIQRGAYHFFDPLEDGARQAEHFLARLGPDLGELPPALDLEWAESRIQPAQGSKEEAVTCGASPAALLTGVTAWLNTVLARTQRHAVIYTTRHFWDACIKDAPPLSRAGLWVAGWDEQMPPLPAQWSSWTFWQYATGYRPGIEAPVDLNWFAGDAAALRRFIEDNGGQWLAPPAPPLSAEAGK
jgi:lysozyme